MEPPPTAPPVSSRRTRRLWPGFILLAIGVSVSLGAMALSRFPGLVERAYAAELGPRIARRLSLLTGWAPFSVAMVVTVALVLGLAARWALTAVRLRGQRGRDRRVALAEEADRLAGVAGTLLLLFYPLWGLNYARAPLDERLGMAADAGIEADALVSLSRLSVARTNEAYLALHGVEDLGRPTRGFTDPSATSRALESGWARVAPALGMNPVAALEYGPVKTRGVTWFVDALDIAGLYVPYTGEAHASGAQPDLSFPAVAAHEQAHQRGLARENEATFAGALAAIHSDDPMARYSGWARVLRALQADLTRVRRSEWVRLRDELVPGVVRDWQDYMDYLVDARSVAAPLVEATNDAYLRAHGVPGGIESYDRVTTLLLEWARSRDGDLLITEP